MIITRPTRGSAVTPASLEPTRCYDVAPDGQSFFVVETAKEPVPAPVTHLNYIPNWLEELKRKVPLR